MQQEEDSKGGSGDGNTRPSSPGNNDSQISYDDDELIDMDDCSDDDGEIWLWRVVKTNKLPVYKIFLNI